MHQPAILSHLSRPFLYDSALVLIYSVKRDIPVLIRPVVFFLNQKAAFPRLSCSMYRLMQINGLTEKVKFRIILGLKTEGTL